MLNKKIPKQIANRYEVLSLIGSGGMSNVYEVKHMVTQERLAIKVIKHKHSSAPIDSQSNTRFLREASLSQRLKTTGVVKIYDAWVDEHASYLVMEFLDGDTLRSLAQKRKITRKQALSYVIQALEITQEAHEHKIIHRDLKPENLFVCKNQKETPIKLLDFGLSRQSDDFALTHTGYFLGTPWYMSPEQAMNPKECTVISDIWSVGVILYEILTDQVPFEGETIPLICMHIYKSPHRPLVEINPKIPKSLSILIDQCLEKEPSKRPESAQILAEQLKDELSIHGHLALFNEIFVGRVPQTNELVDTQDIPNEKEKKHLQELELNQQEALLSLPKKADLVYQATPISRSEFETFLDLKRIDTPVDDDDDLDDKSTVPLSIDDIQAQLAALQNEDHASQDQDLPNARTESPDFHTYIETKDEFALAPTLQPGEKEFYEIKALYQQQYIQDTQQYTALDTDEKPTVKAFPSTSSTVATQHLDAVNEVNEENLKVIDPLSAQANTIITPQKAMLADKTWMGENLATDISKMDDSMKTQISTTNANSTESNQNKVSFLTWIFTLMILVLAIGIWVRKFWGL